MTCEEVVSYVGIDELNLEASVDLYPNPVDKGLLNLTFSQVQGEVSIEMFDSFGKRVMQKSIVLDAVNNVSLDVSELPFGMYIVQIQNSDISINKKIIVINE